MNFDEYILFTKLTTSRNSNCSYSVHIWPSNNASYSISVK